MLAKLSHSFHHWTKGWLIPVVFIALVVFMIVTLPGIQAVSGDIEGLDTLFFYTPEEAFANVASYTAEGREVLRNFHLSADIVNPILYTSFLILLISWLFQHGFGPEHRLQRLNIIPLGAAIFDLLENICIVILLSAYPSQPRSVAWLSTLSTMAKFSFIYGSFGLVLVGLVGALMNTFRRIVSKGEGGGLPQSS